MSQCSCVQPLLEDHRCAGPRAGGPRPGVVGKTPLLRPGEMFEYNSGTSLSTPSGFMGGTYQMVSESGENFDIEIPTFSLDLPSPDRKLN